MKKQVSVICGLCAGTDYLFCDETFDGLIGTDGAPDMGNAVPTPCLLFPDADSQVQQPQNGHCLLYTSRCV